MNLLHLRRCVSQQTSADLALITMVAKFRRKAVYMLVGYRKKLIEDSFSADR